MKGDPKKCAGIHLLFFCAYLDYESLSKVLDGAGNCNCIVMRSAGCLIVWSQSICNLTRHLCCFTGSFNVSFCSIFLLTTSGLLDKHHSIFLG